MLKHCIRRVLATLAAFTLGAALGLAYFQATKPELHPGEIVALAASWPGVLSAWLTWGAMTPGHFVRELFGR